MIPDARPPEGSQEVVAVCVCTDGRRETLRSCLQSVLDQETPTGATVKVVLVDNSGRSDGPPLAEGMSLLCVAEPKPGIPAARNRALETALSLGADWIVFLDDDEVAPRLWLSRLVETARAAGCDVLQGQVDYADTWEEAVQLAGQWRPPAGPAETKPRAAAATNNVILKRWLAAEPLGLRFDEAMAATGGSDGEFFMRAHQSGAVIMRTDDALLVEHRPPERLSLEHASRRAFRVGANCNYRYRKNYSGIVAAIRLALRAMERLMGGIARLFIAGLIFVISAGKGRAMARKALADFCFAWGCIGPYLGFSPDRYH